MRKRKSSLDLAAARAQYDEEVLFVLQQILYFRELDIPLKTIKEIIENLRVVGRD